MSAPRAQEFGRTSRGERAQLFTLEGDGIRARLTDFGACLVSLEVQDAAGSWIDVVLGFDALAAYDSAANPYFGGIVGRVANRIAGARFELEGRTFELDANAGRHHLHGGFRGFDRCMWDAEHDASRVTFRRRSPHGEAGYPGNVDVSASHALGPGRSVAIDYEAVADAPTLLNLTQHSYFNLAGSGTILEHTLELRASRFVTVDGELIPTGELRNIAGTRFDFRTPRALGLHASGHDLCFALDGERSLAPAFACRLVEPRSGRALEIATTQPGLQLYSGGRLSALTGKRGVAIPRFGGVCLETQHFPDAVHHAHFPSTLLRPGERYRHASRWNFSECTAGS